MKKPKKQKPREERKEIKILRVIESPMKEIKSREKKEKIAVQEPLGGFEDFISRDDAPEEEIAAPLGSDASPVQNLEQDLSLIPSFTAPANESDAIKYGSGGGYGNMGYGDVNYTMNKQYNVDTGGASITLGSQEPGRQFVNVGNEESRRVQNATRSQQDKLMDYASQIRTQTEEKKKRMVEG